MAGVRRRVVIECGAAETRAAFLLGDAVIRFWFGPARGDEALPRPPQTGELYLGRVRSVSKPLGGAFVDLGADRDGFLPFGKNGKPPAEGAALIVRVRRPALGEKGPVLSERWREGLDKASAAAVEKDALRVAAPARLSAHSGESRDLWLRSIWEPVFMEAGWRDSDFTIDSGESARALRDSGLILSASVEENPFEAYGAADALDRALDRTIVLSGGARLAFDQAEALTVIDVDSGAAADGASGRLNDKVNIAAAKALPAELSRRGAGGRIVVDFLPPSGAEARKALVEALMQASRGTFEMRAGKLSADGLLDLTAPRARLSLLEQATEPAGEGWPVQGRRFTLDWAGKRAIGALERALAARPSARPRLLAGAGLDAYFRAARPQWAERLAQRFGARFTLARDDRLEERSFDLAE